MNSNPAYLDKAEASFKVALNSPGGFSLPYENLATLYFYKGDNEKTRQFTGKAVKKYPQNPKLWFYLAISEYELGQIEQAVQSIQKALNLDPNNIKYKQVYASLVEGKKFEVSKE